jgi:hypothetical protein
MFVSPGIDKACVLVTFKVVDHAVHVRGVEHADAYQEFKVFNFKPGYSSKQFRLNLGDNIGQSHSTIIGNVHEYGN